jgi:hypothetical protein
VKSPVPGKLHPRKFRLETRLNCIGACHARFGIEIERLVVPLAVDIDHRIQLRILRLVLLLSFFCILIESA